VPRFGATNVIPLAIVPARIFAAGIPVMFVPTPDAGVPIAGVTSVRFVADSPLGNVVLSDGTPLELVITTALSTGVKKPLAPPAVWYEMSFAAPPVIFEALLAVQDVQVPVRLVMTPEAGVPSAGATKVMPLAIVPARIFAAGIPVMFVPVPDDGVPSAGVTNVGLIVSARTLPLPEVVYGVVHADPVEFAIPAPG
jgi:hypothetical protein